MCEIRLRWYNTLKNILKTNPKAHAQNKKFVVWDKNRLTICRMRENMQH